MARRDQIRGDFLLSPVFLASLLALLVNDFVLKPQYPSWLSGILSDLAGMIFFPVFFVAVAEFVAVLLPGRPLATPRWFLITTGIIVLLFIGVKFTDIGADAYRVLVTPLLDTPVGSLTNGSGGVVADAWDLFALLLMPVPILIGFQYRDKRGAAPVVGAAPREGG